LLLAVSLPGASDDLNALFAEANRKLEAGDAAAALEDYNLIIEQEPKADNVWLRRAFARWQLKDSSGARADLAQTLSLNPDHIDAYRLRAMIKHTEGNYEGALEDIDRALDVDTEIALLYVMRAETLMALDRAEEALKELNEAIEIDASMSMAFLYRANVYKYLKNWERALTDYTEVIDQHPDDIDALYERAWIYFYRRDWASAIADARKVIQLAPEIDGTYRVIGYAEFGSGDYKAAAASLSQAVDAQTTNEVSNAYSYFIRHLALKRIGASDDRLASALKQWKDEPWIYAVGQFLTGQISEEQFEAEVGKAEGDEHSGMECEANFYIGIERALAKDRSTARMRFRAAIATDAKGFIELTFAGAELERLK